MTARHERRAQSRREEPHGLPGRRTDTHHRGDERQQQRQSNDGLGLSEVVVCGESVVRPHGEKGSYRRGRVALEILPRHDSHCARQSQHPEQLEEVNADFVEPKEGTSCCEEEKNAWMLQIPHV
jgi:hypothetical protein